MKDHLGSGSPGERKILGASSLIAIKYMIYQEGIYIGYRYYETRYEDYVMGNGNAGDYDYASVVAYPFGHGLSYTEFAYSDMQVVRWICGIRGIRRISVVS